MKKVLCVVICLAIILAMLVGCSSKGGNTAADDISTDTTKPVTITIGMWPEDNDVANIATFTLWQKICQEKYPYITIKPAHYKYAPDTFIPLAESGQVPTMFESWFTEPQKLIDNNYVADITGIMQSYGLDKDADPEVLKLMTKAGKIYGVPRDGYALGLYINMNIFKQAGLIDANGLPNYPKTFEELAETAKIIREKTGKAGFFLPTKDNVGGWHFCNIAWAFGVQFEKQVEGKWVSNFDTPEAAAALQYIKDLKWKYDVLLPSALLGWGDWIKNFGTDQVGMVLAAPDALQNPVNDYQMSKDAIAMAPVPAGPKGQYALMGGTPIMFAANDTPEQLDAAFKFLEIMGRTSKADANAIEGRETDLQSFVEKGYPVGPQPMQVWANKDRVDAITALYEKYRNVNMDFFKPYYDTTFKILKPEERNNCQDLYAILDKAIQKVLMDINADPKAVLKAANMEFQTKFLDKIE
jgi:multiple sugar transport system substrate-binding protein